MPEDTLRLVQEMHADGIEANYIYIDKNNNKINEVNFWNEFAKEHKLKATIGSDFHNKDGLHPVIGFKGEDIRVDEKYIDNIEEIKQRALEERDLDCALRINAIIRGLMWTLKEE